MINREQILAGLRAFPYKQVRGVMFDWETDATYNHERQEWDEGRTDTPCYCAMGAMYIYSGDTEFIRIWNGVPEITEPGSQAVGRNMGLTLAQRQQIITWNDKEGKTLAEIADLIEAAGW